MNLSIGLKNCLLCQHTFKLCSCCSSYTESLTKSMKSYSFNNVSTHYYIAFDFLLEKPESFAKRQDFLQTSVLRNTMEQRISRLGQFINEAQWRFQLVSWNESTNNQKIKNSKKRLAKKIQQLVRTDARRKAEEGQDEGSDDTLQDGSGGETCFFNQLMSTLKCL